MKKKFRKYHFKNNKKENKNDPLKLNKPTTNSPHTIINLFVQSNNSTFVSRQLKEMS